MTNAMLPALQTILKALDINDADSVYRVRGEILKLASETVNATSSCMCQYDATTHITTNIRDINTDKAKRMEGTGDDEGDTYDERDYPTAFNWIQAGAAEPMMIHADELAFGSTEKQEFIELDAYSVLYLPLRKSDTFWGYVEIWESRAKRFFKQKEIETLQQFARAIEQTLG